MKHPHSTLCAFLFLLAVSLAGFGVHLAETLARGWDGLYWATYWHWSFIVAPALFLLWLNAVWKWRLGIARNLAFAVMYAAGFLLLLGAYRNLFNRWLPLLSGFYWQHPLFIIAVPLCENLLLVPLLRLKVRAWEYPLLLLVPDLVNLIGRIMLMGLRELPFGGRFFWYRTYSDLIYQFKTGTVVFAYMLVEGAYILLHKRAEPCGV